MVLSVFLTTGFTKVSLEPKTVYRVYLKGKSLGIIESKDQLEKYIDKEQKEIKQKYNVKKVYLPTDLDKLIEQTKDNVSTQKDPRILKLCKALRRSPEVAKLQDVLAYLAANKYNVDIEELKKKIVGDSDKG